MGQRRTTLASAALALAAALGSGCYPSGGRGTEPVDDQFYFPVSVSLTRTGKWLIVANSDFDLKYNSGTVQALDLGDPTSGGIEQAARECEREMLSSDCLAEPGTQARRDCDDRLTNGLMCFGPPQPDAWSVPYVKASVRIGAFASDMKVVPVYDTDVSQETPVANVSRVLVPVRGDASLTFIDAIESASGITLNCYAGAGPNQLGHDCDANHTVGQDPNANARNLSLEGEPFAIATPDFWKCGSTASGACALEPARSNGIASVVHQTSGDVSVFRNVQLYKANALRIPTLAYTLGGLAVSASAIAALDVTDGVEGDTPPIVPFVPRFLVANLSQSSLFEVSYLGDDGNPDRSVLTASALIPITTQQTGYDTRGIVVDPPAKDEGDRPTRVFLASRSPASLVVGQIDRASGQLHFYENHPLPIGPSRITRSTFLGADGHTHTRVYIASYDSAYVVSYDPDTRRLGGVIKAGRGPYAIAIDDGRKLAYVANFIDGTIQVMDVNPTRTITDPNDKTKTLTVPNELFEQVVFTVGKPQGPRT
jgi:hypothetical protein